MSESANTYRIPKFLKVILITLGVITFLLIGARLMLKTGFAHNLVKDQIVKIAQNSVNGSLDIGKISGDLWNEVLVTDIDLISEDQQIVTLDTLYARYDILSFLSGPYTVNELKLSNSQWNIVQEDSSYNILEVMNLEDDGESGSVYFVLESIRLNNMNASFRSAQLLPDSVLKVQGLQAEASFSLTEQMEAGLKSLSFELVEGRLPRPIAVNTSASYADSTFTLNELLIETGRSLLKANASVALNDPLVEANLQTKPFSLADIDPYLEYGLPKDEIRSEISVNGAMDALELSLTLKGKGFGDLSLHTKANVKDTLILNSLSLEAEYLDMAYFTNDSLRAKTGAVSAEFDGDLSQDIAGSKGEWKFRVTNLQYEEYRAQAIEGNGLLGDDEFKGKLSLISEFGEEAVVNARIAEVSKEVPEWNIESKINGLDLANWTEGSELNSNITLLVIAQGSGFALPDSGLTYSVSNRSTPNSNYESFRIGGEQVDVIDINGQFGSLKTTLFGRFKSEGNELTADLLISDIMSEMPGYGYEFETEDFDLSRLDGFESFPTSINALLKGKGKGSEMATAEAESRLMVKNSSVNGAYIKEVTTEAALSDGILRFNKGVFNSDLLDGSFNGRKNITNFSDPTNRFNLDMTVKQLQPLAPLFDLNILQVTGEIQGEILQDSSGVLASNFSLDLNDIQVDSLFIAPGINGEAQGSIRDIREFDMNLDISKPVISGLVFEDIALASKGKVYDDSLTSNFHLEVIGSDRGRLIQRGDLRIEKPTEEINIDFNTFDFITNSAELTLQQPFMVNIEPGIIRTDTLYLLSTNGAFLQMAVPYADSSKQSAWINGRDFDFGLIQEVIFGERYFDGVLSGDIAFDNVERETQGEADIKVENIVYDGVSADSLILNFNIADRRLEADGVMFWEEKEQMSMNLNVPFVLYEDEITDEYLKQKVNGYLNIRPNEFSTFKPLFQDDQFTNTEGILSFNGKLSGTAENPVIDASFIFDEPTLSGIKLDEINAGFSYDNAARVMKVNSDIITKSVKAATVSVTYPISYDFRTMQFIFPGEEDQIKADIKTEDLNLAVFDDFLDENYLNNLKGSLNADITIEGNPGNLQPDGFINLHSGSVEVPPAGITLSRINADIVLEGNEIKVNKLSTFSGKGEFKLSGTVGLNGFLPGAVDMKATANQFKLANTNDYNMVIDLNTRLTGPATTPKASGSVTVKNGFVYLQNFGDKTVEDVQLEGEEEASFSAYDSLSMDMQINIERNFYVRNRTYLDMELELNGSLDAQKQTNGELELFGSLEGLGGYVQPLGKRFEMQESGFTFSGPVDEPEIYVKSMYTPPTRQKGEAIQLFYIIEGTANDPKFSFDSNPTMEQSDIICYTLFGKPCYSLDSWQSVFAGENTTSAADVLTDVLLDEVEALATRELGVDVVQIDNTGSGTNSGTSIKTGWYLNERTFFAIVNEITSSTPKTLFILEYILNENIDLILTQGDDSRQGIDIRFQYDY